MSEELEKIIFKYLLLEDLSTDEKRVLNLWLSEDKSNHLILGQMRLMLDPKFESEKSRIKTKVWEQLTTGNSKTKADTASFGITKFLRIAAILLLVSLIGVLSRYVVPEEKQVVNEIKYIEKVALAGQKVTTILPDGSKVKLNSGSKLIVPERFTGSLREVTLSGEAFFEVVRDEQKPFHVNVDSGMKVVVVGTSFLVNTTNENDGIVAVRSGKVSVSTAFNEETIVLDKNEVTIVSRFQTLNKRNFTDGDVFFGWVDNKFVLKAAHFQEVLGTIKAWFGYEIQSHVDYSDFDTYSASLSNPSITEVMESLAHSYKFSYDIDDKNKRIIIKK